jgi:hypothetical protein
MTAFSLAARCPRLALARDQHNAMVREQDRKRLALACKIHATERLVAHRELQLQRAFVTGKGTYIASRQRKLAAAERSLTHLKHLAVA